MKWTVLFQRRINNILTLSNSKYPITYNKHELICIIYRVYATKLSTYVSSSYFTMKFLILLLLHEKIFNSQTQTPQSTLNIIPKPLQMVKFLLIISSSVVLMLHFEHV